MAYTPSGRRPVNGPERPTAAPTTCPRALEAFQDLLSHLPDDTGMSFVFIQHLDPSHKSNLAGIFCRSSKMPVAEITDGTELEPDHVYVTPPAAG
ncbi:MAG TPA: chemotaxis protein CheB [Phycisphaerae bacterium]|nr:chemotaxis protein CheB [Phycisphaerae bacterium]HUU22281.1 chemotaxis protein CheB [Phycisphaerae bacterium]